MNCYVMSCHCYSGDDSVFVFLDEHDAYKAMIEELEVEIRNLQKEGYEFIGWYKEQECLNKWNFESDIIAKKEYDNEGNYIFTETRIYAKWKEI